MLRHSLYKKFGKKYQWGAITTGNTNPGSEFRAPAPMGNYTTMAQPDGTISTQDSSFAPGVFSNNKADNMFTPQAGPMMSNMLPENVFDVNQQTPQMEQGPLTADDTKQRGILQPEKTPSAKGPNPFMQDLKNNWSDYATLGLAGVSGVLNYQDGIRKDQELQKSIQQRGSKPLYDYNWMHGRTTSGGTEYQPTIMAQKGANIRRPLNSTQTANVEIEGGEFLILPDGTTELTKGPSHSKGGVDTILPEGTKVFSNHLKPMDLHKMPAEYKQMLVGGYMQSGGEMGDFNLDYLDDMVKGSTGKGKDSKKTFAKIAQRYDTKQYQDILKNPFAPAADKQTAQLMLERNSKILDQLFRDQQILNGNSTGEPMPEEPQMKNGGITNAGFEALPEYVQEKIISSMKDGGTNPGERVGKITGYGKANIPSGNVTPTGKQNTFSSSNQKLQDYLSSWEDEIPGVSSNMTEGEAQKAIYEWSLKNNPEAIQEMWSEFGLTKKGLKNQQLTKLTKDGKGSFDPEVLKNPETLQQLEDAYVDNLFGARKLKKKAKPETPPEIPPQQPPGQLPPQPNPKAEPEKMPQGQDYSTSIQTPKASYKGLPYDIRQDIPGAYGLAQAQDTFPYAIPEVEAPYIRPQTLNIQSQLQDSDNNAIAAMRYGADPNLAYIAGLDSKQKAFETKQNYDAEGRSKADLYNADAKFKADSINANLFNNVYNDMYAGAKSAQSEEKQKAITALTTNRAKYNQDENLKEFYYNNFVPNYNVDLTKSKTMTPTGGVQFNNIAGVNPTSTTQTTSSTTPSPATAGTPQAGAPQTAAPTTSPSAPPTSSDPFMMKQNLNPNLPLSMQYGPMSQPNFASQAELMYGGQVDTYFNPFKKKKGFRKK
jgi:hypothetical protein